METIGRHSAPISAANDVTLPNGSRKLRIALFAGNYNYVMDGPVRALNTLVGFLERQGHEVLVFAPTCEESYLPHEGTLISLPSFAAPRRKEYRVALGLGSQQKRALAAFRPDLIHVSAPDLGGRAALKFARANKIPAVASFHTRFDTYPRYYGLRWLEPVLTAYMRRFYGKCEHVYPPSQSMADELIRDGIGHDLRLWARGVDHDAFSPNHRDMAWRRSLGINDDDIVILFVGRLVLEKGLAIFAEALGNARARCRNVRALVVGEGPERARFADMLEKDDVFVGHQSGEGLSRAYASADIFFNPSITETFGNVTLEAMASGLPAICAKAAGSTTLVEDGFNGFLADPNVKDFGKKLVTLCQAPQRREEFGRNARERSFSYSWDAVLNGLLENYYDAIANYDQGPRSPNEDDKSLSKAA